MLVHKDFTEMLLVCETQKSPLELDFRWVGGREAQGSIILTHPETIPIHGRCPEFGKQSVPVLLSFGLKKGIVFSYLISVY